MKLKVKALVYMEKFILSVLVDGKFQKELANGTVNIPYGAEYKLRLRNKNARRAVAKVFIDGENVSEGGFIVNSNDFIEIERPATNGVHAKFKFVSLESGEAIDHGKNGSNDDKVKGLIEVRWHMEKEHKPAHIVRPYHYGGPMNSAGPGGSIFRAATSSVRSRGAGGSSADNDVFYGASACSASVKGTSDAAPVAAMGLVGSFSKNVPAEKLNDGCTVEGGHSSQSFSYGHCEHETAYVTTKVFLQGFNAEEVEERLHVAATTPTYNPSPSPLRRKPRRVEPVVEYETESARLAAENAELEDRLAAALRTKNDRLKQQLAELDAVA